MADNYKSRIAIVATNAEIFEKLLSMRDGLPDACCEFVTQITGGLVGTEVHVDLTNNSKNENVWLPPGTTQITNFGHYIGVYAGKYFLKITGIKDGVHPSYIIYGSGK